MIPFFVFPPAIRKVIYTTNAIESINAQLRKIIKTRGHFPNDDAATKLIWLGLRNITANWGSAAHDWKSAMNQFAILYGDRFIRRLGESQGLPDGRPLPARTQKKSDTSSGLVPRLVAKQPQNQQSKSA